MLSESKYLADFLVGFLGKKPQTLLITTVLYDKQRAARKASLQSIYNQYKEYCMYLLIKVHVPIIDE